MLPTISSALHMQRTTAQGPQVALGSMVTLGASQVDKTLAWIVTSTGVLAGGPQFGPFSGATHSEVKHLANTGPQTWIYVYNDSGTDIGQGSPVIPKASVATRNVKNSPNNGDDPGRVVGVAQWDLPTGYYGWILREGVGEVLAGAGAIAANASLVLDNDAAALGEAEDASGVTIGSFGWSTEAAADGALATCYINCRG